MKIVSTLIIIMNLGCALYLGLYIYTSRLIFFHSNTVFKCSPAVTEWVVHLKQGQVCILRKLLQVFHS